MNLVAGQHTIRVPASSANLGPGFDSLGLALSLYDEITVEEIPSGLEVSVTGEAADSVPRDQNHLVVSTMYTTFDLLGVRPEGLRVTCRNAIPHGRGLGSSSAAIVGGIAAARTLAGPGGAHFEDQDAFQLANDLEGHPDNVAAAMYGGFTIAWIEGAAARSISLPSTTTTVTAFIPPEPVSTSESRCLLPTSVPHPDAAANAGRAALLVAALNGRPELLLAATEDRLHQPYRSQAMPTSHRLVRSLRLHGVAAIISGAGPTVLAFDTGLATETPVDWRHLELDVDPSGVKSTTQV